MISATKGTVAGEVGPCTRGGAMQEGKPSPPLQSERLRFYLTGLKGEMTLHVVFGIQWPKRPPRYF